MFRDIAFELLFFVVRLFFAAQAEDRGDFFFVIFLSPEVD